VTTRLNTLLLLLAVGLAVFAVMRPARAQSAPVAICTPLAIMSADPVAADLALEDAINAHLAAGRVNILVRDMQPAPGPFVCGW
jgi:hypothetical protein